jgi:elongation factor P--beta-lysine ligase
MALKRLLAGGAGPVFELARVWRNGETGRAPRA